MKKVLFLVSIGAAIGYFAGFSDARHHDKNVVQRWVVRVGTKSKGTNDIDAAMDRIEKK